MFEEQFRDLQLAEHAQRAYTAGNKGYLLDLNKEGKFEVTASLDDDRKRFLQDLNWLVDLNNRSLDESTDEALDAKLDAILSRIAPSIAKLTATDTLVSSELVHFLQVVSLMVANYEINSQIKQEMSQRSIENISMIFYKVLNILRSLEVHHDDFLLTKTSFISPLLITISFAHKLNNPMRSTLVTVLAILYTYMLRNEYLIKPVLGSFIVTSTTNMNMFQIFNKLWDKTLNSTNMTNNIYSPGPIDIINRLNALADHEISQALLETVFPYHLNGYLYELSQSTLKLYSDLMSIKTNTDINQALSNLLLRAAKPSNSQLLLILLETFRITGIFKELERKEEHKLQVSYISFKISLTPYTYQKETYASLELRSNVLDKEILLILEKSFLLRYQVLFEVIDHNYKIDFRSDFPMLLSLEQSLILVNKNFELLKDHCVLSDLGSALSLPSVFTYISFILAKELLSHLNPKKKMFNRFDEIMDLSHLPPLPRSQFLDFGCETVSKTQLNLNNFQKLVSCLHLSLSLLQKIIYGYIKSGNSLNVIKNLDNLKQYMELRSSNKLLELYFAALFGVLSITIEFESKSKSMLYNGTANHFSAIFYDYASIGSILKLQVFEIFDKLFGLYDSLAIYVLIKFVSDISLKDLKLQKISMELLNYLVFETENNLDDMIVNNDILKQIFTNYINVWNDGSIKFKSFGKLLGLSEVNEDLVQLDIAKYQKLLGFQISETLSNSSPLSSSGSLINNSSFISDNNSSFQQKDINSKSTLPTTSSSYMNSSQFMYNNNYNQMNSNSTLTTPSTATSFTFNDSFNHNFSRTTADDCTKSTYNNIKSIQSFIPQQFDLNSNRVQYNSSFDQYNR